MSSRLTIDKIKEQYKELLFIIIKLTPDNVINIDFVFKYEKDFQKTSDDQIKKIQQIIKSINEFIKLIDTGYDRSKYTSKETKIHNAELNIIKKSCIIYKSL